MFNREKKMSKKILKTKSSNIWTPEEISKYRKDMYVECIDDPEKIAKLKIKKFNEHKKNQSIEQNKLKNLVNKLILDNNEIDYQRHFIPDNNFYVSILNI